MEAIAIELNLIRTILTVMAGATAFGAFALGMIAIYFVSNEWRRWD